MIKTIKIYTLAISILLLNAIQLTAQTSPKGRGCGTGVPGEIWDSWFNQKVEEYKAQTAKQGAKPLVTITIPVVVHVLHGGVTVGTFPNITAAQINSQIKVLNDDFAGHGYNSQSIAATGFSAVGIADTKITFCLAQFDPQGNVLSEPGIDRINYSSNSWQNPNSFGSPATFQTYMDGTVKPATIWDPTQYFNIWISDVNLSAGLLGYATFPMGAGLTGLSSNFGNAGNDGVWVWAKCFGTIGFLDGTYNRGRTAVHETGHWLGLRHIGGDAIAAAGDCNATDYCNDTPPQKGGFASGSNGQNFGSPTYPLHVGVCNSTYGDMFMNFMDYCDDQVLYMFTPEQNIRMQAALQNGVFRNQLSASSLTQCAGLPAILFADVQNGCFPGAQPLDFQSDALASTNYTWSALPANGVVFSPSANSASPAVSFPSGGTYTISVVAINTIGVSSSSTEVVASECLGLADRHVEGIGAIVWPNPASNQLHIRITTFANALSCEVKVLDLPGKTLLLKNIGLSNGAGSLELNVEELPKGLYLICFEVNGRLITRKFEKTE